MYSIVESREMTGSEGERDGEGHATKVPSCTVTRDVAVHGLRLNQCAPKNELLRF